MAKTLSFTSRMGGHSADDLTIVTPNDTIVYNPFTGAKTVDMTELGGAGIEYISLNATRSTIDAIIATGKLPVLKTIQGQGEKLLYPAWTGNGDYVFGSIDANSGFWWARLSKADSWTTGWQAFPSDSGGSKTTNQLAAVIYDTTYFKSLFTNPTDWLNSYGDKSPKVILNTKNDAIYRANIEMTEISSCDCQSCGIAVVIDTNKLGINVDGSNDTEAINMQLELNIRYVSSAFTTSAGALSAVPIQNFIKVHYTAPYGEQLGFWPLKSPVGYDGSVYYYNDNFFLDRQTVQDTDGTYKCYATAKVILRIAGTTWSLDRI